MNSLFFQGPLYQRIYSLSLGKINILKTLGGLRSMNNEKSNSSHDIAKQMLIDGETFDAIMEKTNLRLKDIKQIQRDEINPKF